MSRHCGYCGASMTYDPGVGAYGQSFCDDACVDDFEKDQEDSRVMEYEAALDAINDEYGIY